MARQFSRWSGIPFVGLRFSNVMERADYERFPAFWEDPHLRKWNLWSYVDESHVAKSVRLALVADIGGADGVRHRRAADTVMASATASPATTRCSGSTRLAGCSGYSPTFSWREVL